MGQITKPITLLPHLLMFLSAGTGIGNTSPEQKSKNSALDMCNNVVKVNLSTDQVFIIIVFSIVKVKLSIQ